MNSLAEAVDNPKSKRSDSLERKSNISHWALSILLGPFLSWFWAISENATYFVLLPGVAYLFILSQRHKEGIKPRLIDRLDIVEFGVASCAICNSTHQPQHNFMYRKVREIAPSSSLGLLDLVAGKHWESIEKQNSAVCIFCGVKAITSKMFVLLFWTTCLIALAYAFEKCGIIMQILVLSLVAATLATLRYHLVCLMSPLMLCRLEAMEALERRELSDHTQYELMSDSFWRSLENGVETVESDEEMVACLQMKILGYALAAAIGTSLLSIS